VVAVAAGVAVGACVAVGAGVALAAGEGTGVGSAGGTASVLAAVAGTGVSLAATVGDGVGLSVATAAVAPGLAVAAGSASASTVAGDVAGAWVTLPSPLQAARSKARRANEIKSVERFMGQTFLTWHATTAPQRAARQRRAVYPIVAKGTWLFLARRRRRPGLTQPRLNARQKTSSISGQGRAG
jgi:hypothetical protein